MTPFAELLSQGSVFPGQGAGLEILQTLVNQVEGVVDQLGSLFGGHGGTGAVGESPDVQRL